MLFRQLHGMPPLRLIWVAARVDRRDFRRWRKGQLPDTSAKSKRIELVLYGQIRLRPPSKTENKPIAPHCIAPLPSVYRSTMDEIGTPGQQMRSFSGLSFTAQLIASRQDREDRSLSGLIFKDSTYARDRLLPMDRIRLEIAERALEAEQRRLPRWMHAQ